MKTTVKIRSFETGQFCTLAQLCAEEPRVMVQRRDLIQDAVNHLDEDRAAMLQAEQLCELIDALNIPFKWTSGYLGLRKEGGWIGYAELLSKFRENLAHNERIAALWHATEYTVGERG